MSTQVMDEIEKPDHGKTIALGCHLPPVWAKEEYPKIGSTLTHLIRSATGMKYTVELSAGTLDGESTTQVEIFKRPEYYETEAT